MSTRLAARFGTGGGGEGGGSRGGSSSSHSSKPKKFCTQGEEFYDFLKALGYQPPKHQQYEHFEYLFQDEKSSSFVKKLMSMIKPQNGLSLEEIGRFEELKEEGAVLYGADLEQAVSKRHTLNEMYSDQRLKQAIKKQEMGKALQEKEQDLEKLEHIQLAFSQQLSDWQTSQAKATHMAGVIERLMRQAELTIEIDIRLLSEKMEDLEQSVVQLKKDLNVDRQKGTNAYICQINGRRLLETEEKLFEMVQDMIRKHGTTLIMKEAGYGIEGDPLSAENINKVYSQYEKDFERLKHCTIFEKVHQQSLEIEYAGQLGISEGFHDCYRRASEFGQYDEQVRSKQIAETDNSIRDLISALTKEKGNMEDLARNVSLVAVNKQFSALTNIKTRSKKKLQEFFSLVVNVLKAQKVRMSLIRNLIKSEARLYAKLLNNIEENIAVSQRHSKRLAIKEKSIPEFSDLTQEGQILHSILTHFGIPSPLAVISNSSSVLTFLRKSIHEIDNAYWNEMERLETEFLNDRKHLSKTHQVLKETLRNVTEAYQRPVSTSSPVTGKRASSTDESEPSPPQHFIQAEENMKKLEEQLNSVINTESTLIKEGKKRHEECIQKAQEILDSMENNNDLDLTL